MKLNTRPVIYFVLVSLVVVSCFIVVSGIPVTDGKENSAKIPDSVLFTSAPVLSPAQALHTFQVEKGFRIELVASEPLIQDPVAMDFDEAGRLWVLEMQSYMPDAEGNGELQKTSRIVILDDRDGDGRMDHSKVFLDSLVLPRALRIINGGILYAEPPNLWFVENLDDKPGKRTLVDSAYAVGGNPEHQPNGLMRGIDNWYYNAKSDTRYRFENGQWKKEETEFRGQWGITRDNYGRLIYNTNSNQLRGDLVPPNMMSRNPSFSPALGINTELAANQQVYPVRPTPGINRGYKDDMLDEEQKLQKFTAASGPVIYRGNKFPEEYQGNAFVCEPAANLIKRNILSEEGPYLTASQAYPDREFLASTDERFRPVSLYNGPDGNLYVVDMYRGIIQHKTFLTDYLYDQIISRDLQKPTGLGRIYRIVYEGSRPDNLAEIFSSSTEPFLHQAKDEELVSFLSHPNGWWRDNAQRLLVERRNRNTIPELVELLKSGEYKNHNFIHALWALEGMGVYTPEITGLGVQHTAYPKVVATALRIGERNSKSQEAAKMLDIYGQVLPNENPEVQLQLALSLGEFMEEDPERVLGMLKRITHVQGDDSLTREAILSSLNGQESKFLELLKQEGTPATKMISFLGEVISKTVEKKQLKEKELSEAEKEQYVMGKALYEKTCAGCHSGNGEGLVPVAPPLAGSEWVTGDEERLILVALHGLKGPVMVNGKLYKEPEVQPVMPGFKQNPEFTDEKIAALLTYIRNAWGNKGEAVDGSTVNSVRKSSMDQEEPFTAKDFMP